MKTSIALLLALLLMVTMFAGCGEEKPSDETVTTTTVKGVATTVSDSTTDHANGTGGSSATTTKAPTVSTVDPKNYKDNHYYVGALQPDGTGLVRPRLLFEGEYCVIMHYMYSAVKSDDDQQPFEYQGKTYYGEGEGMSPCTFEMTATEILVKSSTVMKLVLQSDGKMRVTASTDPFFPVGLLLTPTAA